MIKITAILVAALSLTACMSGAPSFSWYHPEGGEFLFAYDKNECAALDRSDGLDRKGPFFACMHQRGYYLVDANGEILAAPSVIGTPDGPQLGAQ